MTDKRNWKSDAFLLSISLIGSMLLLYALVETANLPLLTSSGFLSWVVLLVLTLAASRFSSP